MKEAATEAALRYFNVGRVRAGIGPRCFVDLGFELGRLLDQARSDVWIPDGLAEFEKRFCLTRKVPPADHSIPPCLPNPNTSRGNRDFVPPNV